MLCEEKQMVRLKQKKYHKGLTLIEVLIALTIVSVAMLAIIKATSQNIRATNYLQDKTLSAWAAQNLLNQTRVKLLRFPNAPDHLKGETKILDRTYYFQASQDVTPNRHINKITIDMFTDVDQEENPITHLESYALFED